jgi:hypothetical protein
MQCHAHGALWRGLEKSLSERHGRGMAGERHGMCQLAFILLVNASTAVEMYHIYHTLTLCCLTIYIIYVYISYRTANFQTLYVKYL